MKNVLISLAAVAVVGTLIGAFLLITRDAEPDADQRSVVALDKKVLHAASCNSRLTQIGRAIRLYMDEHDGTMPPDLQTLVSATDWLQPRGLVFLTSDDQSIPGDCSYVYRGAGLCASSPADMIVAYDKCGNHGTERNVLFVANWAKQRKFGIPGAMLYSAEEFKRAIDRDNQLRRELGMPASEVPGLDPFADRI